MTRPPTTTRPYRRTASFSAGSTPTALLRDHKTKAGVWGVIHVERGRIAYRIAATGETRTLTPGRDGLIEPEALHSVAPSDDAVFHVEFWR